ncbi:hypothetical protein [Pseudoalteromonas luteoviolacea]|uniref:Uncharacterized protein n=1 Tax=Pseudoalteromonas luteoviolacea H33 TaxID=1365251 RepID=A0A167AY07_9GAMM|nr:hypothetical protein [Pseudoalteromonas luteoviolacea]KZN45935.1 hypothetical protein N476_24660 [Pseudoalteromonas luteoviolacea H33]KZN71224.1 hypothetical protein N477_25680 [Pseudoalteromonas luteoviolacea H33-S]MBQ4880376.1 hypothetical protein [Pseudoalteromonas luteoviolacea]MBQ4909443.1 hypothetical protein [Pseudoalteromonas luteoviolacea]
MNNCKDVSPKDNTRSIYMIFNDFDKDVVKEIFKVAYLAGREDGLNGIYLDYSLVFEAMLAAYRR